MMLLILSLRSAFPIFNQLNIKKKIIKILTEYSVLRLLALDLLQGSEGVVDQLDGLVNI